MRFSTVAAAAVALFAVGSDANRRMYGTDPWGQHGAYNPNAGVNSHSFSNPHGGVNSNSFQESFDMDESYNRRMYGTNPWDQHGAYNPNAGVNSHSFSNPHGGVNSNSFQESFDMGEGDRRLLSRKQHYLRSCRRNCNNDICTETICIKRRNPKKYLKDMRKGKADRRDLDCVKSKLNKKGCSTCRQNCIRSGNEQWP
jgi:hypothetical protein